MAAGAMFGFWAGEAELEEEDLLDEARSANGLSRREPILKAIGKMEAVSKTQGSVYLVLKERD